MDEAICATVSRLRQKTEAPIIFCGMTTTSPASSWVANSSTISATIVLRTTIGPAIDWAEPTTGTGRLTLRMKMARVHLYELLAELAEVPDVTGIGRERFEKIKPTTAS